MIENALDTDPSVRFSTDELQLGKSQMVRMRNDLRCCTHEVCSDDFPVLSGREVFGRTKSDGSTVTAIDIAVAKALFVRMLQCDSEIPVLCEEDVPEYPVESTAFLIASQGFGQAVADRRTFWVVDPIDGTDAYANGSDDYSVMAALFVNGRPFGSLVYCPANGWCFTASVMAEAVFAARWDSSSDQWRDAGVGFDTRACSVESGHRLYYTGIGSERHKTFEDWLRSDPESRGLHDESHVGTWENADRFDGGSIGCFVRRIVTGRFGIAGLWSTKPWDIWPCVIMAARGGVRVLGKPGDLYFVGGTTENQDAIQYRLNEPFFDADAFLRSL